MTIKTAAQASNIPYENAKVLNRLFKREGRVCRINSMSSKKATGNPPKRGGSKFKIVSKSAMDNIKPLFYSYKIEKKTRKRSRRANKDAAPKSVSQACISPIAPQLSPQNSPGNLERLLQV